MQKNYNSLALDFMREVNETIKELMQRVGGADPSEGADTMREKLRNQNLFLQTIQSSNDPLKAIVTIRFKKELITGFYIEVNSELNTVKRVRLDDEEELQSFMSKLKERVIH
jgi:DNA replication initiation complex subunit (GINS family)